jgi:8-oxo-dGTP pyrophosphatase MutT (NUDIX family)
MRSRRLAPSTAAPVACGSVTTPVQQLRPAATVVVVRDGQATDGTPGIETLMLRRNEHGQFGGMWVFPGGRVDDDDVDPTAPDDEVAAGRRAAVREAMEEAGVVLDPAALVVLSHWRPPSTAPKGFATWFFVAAGSDADVAVDGHEIHEHAWLAPVEVLRRRDAGEVTLVPPTFVTLTVLAAHATVGDLLAALGTGTPERFHTQIGRDGETAMACWHGDEAYDVQPGPPGARHRLIMSEDGWRYERSSVDPSTPS